MRRKQLFYKFFPAYLLIILVCSGGVGVYVSLFLRDFYIATTKKNLETQARLLEHQIAGLFSREHQEVLDALVKTLGRAASTRITVILPSGEVLADSDTNPQTMDNHRERPEVKEALAGQIGSATHYSRALREDMLYLAAPVLVNGTVIGIIRVAHPLTEIDRTLESLYLKIAFSGVLAAIIAGIISFVASRRMSTSIARMKKGAERFAMGEFAQKVRIPDTEELAGLAEVLNHMAQQLDEKIRVITRERNEREVLLSSMREGLIAVDAQGRILALNGAVEHMFGIALPEAKGRLLLEVIRNIDLQRFVANSIQSGKPLEAEIVLSGPEEKFLQVHSSSLASAENAPIGTLVVLNDSTRLRRLEKMRKEFIANISHEIKTPITSIKACVETLQDEGMSDCDTAQRFLEILLRQTDRLNKIVDDLLTLSRIEWLEEKKELQREKVNLHDFLQIVVSDSGEKASVRKIDVMLQCDPGISACVNPLLLEQAVANLLDNAIKFSTEGARVTVQAVQEGKDIHIKVIDTGCGIAREYISRLFERFYRVDKDRSRQSGGTGLGLAIVKHIAQAHGGSVSVESSPGKGSTFTIRLPASCSA